jgi:hypothetical protein
MHQSICDYPSDLNNVSRISLWQPCSIFDCVGGISLAGINYHRILSDEGGPLSRVDQYPVEVGNDSLIASYAYLAEGVDSSANDHTLFANVSGCAIHKSPLISYHMACSEAIERWAFREKSEDWDASMYGFDIDPSTNGMAAFPSLRPTRARANSYAEAWERYVLFNWWIGRLEGSCYPTHLCGISAVKIQHRFGDFSVIVLYQEDIEFDAMYYGFSVGKDDAEAFQRAFLELFRHRCNGRKYALKHPLPTLRCVQDKNIYDRRAIYFTFGEGRLLFKERLGINAWMQCPKPKLVCDLPISGPWNAYAYVWRVVFEPPTAAHNPLREDFFFW